MRRVSRDNSATAPDFSSHYVINEDGHARLYGLANALSAVADMAAIASDRVSNQQMGDLLAILSEDFQAAIQNLPFVSKHLN
jgi:hypothetical protein